VAIKLSATAAKARIIRVSLFNWFNIGRGMNQKNPEPCELAEIVYEKPLSGEFDEILFGSDRANTLWVKFSDKDGAGEWIGKFGVGGGGPGRVIKFAEPDQFIVSAGSFAYFVDATNRKLVGQYQNDAASEIIYDNERKNFIVAGLTDLQWVEPGGKLLFSRSVSVDGIWNLKIEGNILSGFAYKDYEDERRFWFDLDKLKILRWEKPWWKFW
jgi:hypothetical protein